MTDLSLLNGGTRLAASVHGAVDAAPILLLHGLTMSRDTWDEIIQRLGDRYCVWTLDFRGHGHSDGTPNYDLAGYVSDAETALAAIGRPAIVAGALARGMRCRGPCSEQSERTGKFSSQAPVVCI